MWEKEKIIVFGTGRYFETKKAYISNKYNVVAYIDNKVAIDNRIFDSEGNTIYSPENINCLPNCKIFLMSAKYYEMYEQLTNSGIENERIVFGFLIPPAYDKTEEIIQKYCAKINCEKSKLWLDLDNKSYDVSDEQKFHSVINDLYHKEYKEIDLIASLNSEPLSRRFGKEHGKAIDRFYIEKFLAQNNKFISGDVLEVADSTYTKKYAKGNYIPHILHVNGWGEGNVIKGNLETGEGIIEDSIDCFICTQTIQFIFDVDAVMANIYKLLKDGGAALITAAGIAQISKYDYLNWGEYWRFTQKAMERICEKHFGVGNVKVNSYGNMKVSIAMLYGLSQDDLTKEDFEYEDDQYPMIVSAVCIKRNKDKF